MTVECATGEEFLELCARVERGELVWFSVEASPRPGVLWSVECREGDPKKELESEPELF